MDYHTITTTSSILDDQGWRATNLPDFLVIPLLDTTGTRSHKSPPRNRIHLQLLPLLLLLLVLLPHNRALNRKLYSGSAIKKLLLYSRTDRIISSAENIKFGNSE